MLGSTPFDVSSGIPSALSQEVVCIDKTEQQFSTLGPIAKQIVITPDFEALLPE